MIQKKELGALLLLLLAGVIVTTFILGLMANFQFSGGSPAQFATIEERQIISVRFWGKWTQSNGYYSEEIELNLKGLSRHRSFGSKVPQPPNAQGEWQPIKCNDEDVSFPVDQARLAALEKVILAQKLIKLSDPALDTTIAQSVWQIAVTFASGEIEYLVPAIDNPTAEDAVQAQLYALGGWGEDVSPCRKWYG